ncbi:stage II sporulation protein P [Camelliibacillus cellulosilyticus]|uniref:Stage II sporulation protein P n=1 Tax=Camelliibacillus cellulosilyticus TaxID=2174486 RepID=A0ABV9GL61_9BACL
MIDRHLHHSNQLSLRQLIPCIPIVLLTIFIVVGLLTAPTSKRLLFFGNVKDALSGLKAETLIEMMGWQNPYLKEVLPEGYQKISFTKFAFQMSTHIDFEDERSLLGNELPGFSIYDTKILVAGEGTNYTNVPIESPPPLDYILKKQKEEGSQKEEQKPPAKQDVASAQVFLYSTHSWESYLPLLGKAGAKDANLATSSTKNVHLIDEMLRDALTKKNINTMIDETNIAMILQKKGWNTNRSYDASRSIVAAAVDSKKKYQLFIDIHRDSARKQSTTATIKGEPYARVSLVVGTSHANADNNINVANKLNDMLKARYPGLSKGVMGKSRSEGNGVYNQDLSPRAVLIEVGGVDNTMDELQRTVSALADVISDYVKNAKKV